jgi:GNAT superfamily N-acetyltransferase
MKVNIRHVKPNDYCEITDLNAKNYPENYREEEQCLVSKIEGCYEGCLVADLDGIIGYIVSFPYLLGRPFPIDSLFEPVKESNCWYIHGLCICKEFRGKGIAKELTKTVISKNSNAFCVTAIEESEKFWEKIGFRTFFELDYCKKRASYMILVK